MSIGVPSWEAGIVVHSPLLSEFTDGLQPAWHPPALWQLASWVSRSTVALFLCPEAKPCCVFSSKVSSFSYGGKPRAMTTVLLFGGGGWLWGLRPTTCREVTHSCHGDFHLINLCVLRKTFIYPWRYPYSNAFVKICIFNLLEKLRVSMILFHTSLVLALLISIWGLCMNEVISLISLPVCLTLAYRKVADLRC